MKKSILLAITISILVLVCLTTVLVSFIKAKEAEKAMLVAEQNLIEAQRQAEIANAAAVLAREAQAESEKLRQELLECQSK